MEDNAKVTEAVSELKNADEDSLKAVIEKWFETTRTQGLKIGANMICGAIANVIAVQVKSKPNPSKRDYERAIKEITRIISVPLKNSETEQNNGEENEQEGGI